MSSILARLSCGLSSCFQTILAPSSILNIKMNDLGMNVYLIFYFFILIALFLPILLRYN